MVNHNGSENEAAESKPGQSRSVSMKLGDQDLASLLDEIVHAVRNDVPIVDTMQRLASERMGQLGRVAKKIAEKLESGGSQLRPHSSRPRFRQPAGRTRIGDSATAGSVASMQTFWGCLLHESDPESMRRESRE